MNAINKIITTPANFLPIIITDMDETQKIMSGRLTMKLAISQDVMKQLNEMLPAGLKKTTSVEEQIKQGSMINYAIYNAVGLSLYPLEFSNHNFQQLSERYSTLGDYAIVIYDPQEFLYRINQYYAINQPNAISVDVAPVEYKNNEINPETYDIFARPVEDSWKREIYIVAAMKQDILLENVGERVDEQISIGDLSDIAVVVKTEDLIEEKFPSEIEDSQFKNFVDSFSIPNKGIRGWRLSVMADIQYISPIEKWIQNFEEFLPKSMWSPVAFIDQLYYDGDSMDRLAFYKNGGSDKISFYINRIEFEFAYYDEQEKKIVEALLNNIYKECNTRFCRMSLETDADLGLVEERWLSDYQNWQIENSFVKNNLVYSQFLTMDDHVSKNIFGLNMAKRSWHYKTVVSTPFNETIKWYDAATVMDFYEDVAAENMKNVQELIKGDVYVGYHQMQRHN